jgi:hypothetical protein
MKNLFELYMIKGGRALIPPKPTSKLKFEEVPESVFIKLAYAPDLPDEQPPNPPGGPPFPERPFPFPRPGPGPLPGPPPGPPEAPPQGPPIPIRQPTPMGTGITVYGDGRTNINTAWDPVLGALGFLPETVKRILWYRLSGHVFKQANADYIVKQLLKTGWLKTGEPLYTQIVLNIKNVANTGKLKINSSYFRVRITAETSHATPYTAVAVVKRFRDINGKVRFNIVSWWETSWI